MKIINSTGILPNGMDYRIIIEQKVNEISVLLRAEYINDHWMTYVRQTESYGNGKTFSQALRLCLEAVQKKAGVTLIEDPIDTIEKSMPYQDPNGQMAQEMAAHYRYLQNQKI